MAANNYIATYKRFNGTDWDTFYFATLATQVSETSDRKFLTATQQGYLVNKDAVGGVPILVTGGKIAVGQIPDLSATYLTKANPVFTGNMSASSGYVVAYGFLNQAHEAGVSGSGLQFESQGEIDFYILGTNKSYLDDYGWHMGGLPIKGVATPSDNTDVATKAYVDGLIASGVKIITSVKAVSSATTIPTTLVSCDGYTPTAGDRILLNALTAVATRGIYTVSASGSAWVRVSNDSLTGSLVFIENGTLYNDYSFYCSDETNGTWIVYAKVDTYKAAAGGGLSKSATNEFSLAAGYGDTINPYASKTKNYVLAAPSTANGVPTFRLLVPKDLPILEAASPDLTDGVLSRVTSGGGHLFIGLGGTSALGLYDTVSFASNNPDLVAIEALAGTSGLLKKTATNTWALDTAAYITGITKAMVEAVLTGTITTHSHTFGIVAGSFAEGNHSHTSVGSAAPGTTGYRTGDLYFQGTTV